jgi:hypothetical protein
MQKPRKMQEGQLIHESVFNKMDDATTLYKPKATTYDGSEWYRRDSGLVEPDPYESAAQVFLDLKNANSPKISNANLNALIALSHLGK